MLGAWRSRLRLHRKLRLLKRAGINSRDALRIGDMRIQASRKRRVQLGHATGADLLGGARYETRLAKRRHKRGEDGSAHDEAAAFLRRIAREVGDGVVSELKPKALAAAFKEADEIRGRRLGDARSTFEQRRRRAFKGIVGYRA